MKRIYSLIAMVMAFVFSASAADLEAGSFSVGVRAGVGLSNVTGDYDGDNSFGFHAGAVGDYFFTDMFYGEAGLLLSKKGYKIPGVSVSVMGASVSAGDDSYDLWYLELPILAGGRFSVSDAIAINAQVGPYIGYGLFGDFDDCNLKKFDFGAKAQAGVFFNNFSVNLGYSYGFMNIADEVEVKAYGVSVSSDAGKAHNTLMYLTLGYNF